jgi:hypothetical protein
MKFFTTSRACLFIAIALCLNAIALPRAMAIELTRNGAPRATIIVAQSVLGSAKGDASAQKVSIAAHDLQDYIRKISGATLPIVGDKSTFTGNAILVGKSALTEQLQSAIPSGLTSQRKEEGFLIDAKNVRLVLAGNDTGPYHGTEYAVYDFLNRLGVRWFMPGEYGEYVPSQKSIDFADITVREKPDFIQRNWWNTTTPEMAAQERRWKIRNKMNPDQMFASASDNSFSVYYVSPNVAKTEPDLFAQNFNGSINTGYPNLSNPKSVEITAEKLKEFFRTHPETNSTAVAPNDGYHRDFTPASAVRNQGFVDTYGREGVPGEVSTTEEWFEWINAVAANVAEEFPDRVISTNGYANRSVPPFGVKIAPNLGIMYAAIWSDTLHAYDDPKSWQMRRQAESLQRWCQLSNRVWLYGYDYSMLVSGLTPLPTTRKLARDMPLLKKWGLIGFLDETRNIWAERGIMTKYVKARLEWNANDNVDALLTDYYAHWYGAAAKPSRAFWDALEKVVESTPVLGHEDRILPYVYTPHLMQQLATHLAEAEKIALPPREKEHVKIDRLIYEHLKAYVAMNNAEFAGNFAEAAHQAQKMLAVRPQLHAINSFLIMPSERLANGAPDPNSGAFYWGISDRLDYYNQLANKLSGKTGRKVAVLPQYAKFALDPYDDGRFAGWYKPNWDTSKWQNILATEPFYLQGHMSKDGHPYLGKIWYQFKVRIPQTVSNQKVLLYAPTVESEAWVWVNGQYIGHKAYREAYERPNQFEMDVTKALKPGTENVVSIEVSTSRSQTAAAGGLVSRIFLYSPNAAP